MEQNLPHPEVTHVVVFRIEGNLSRYEDDRIELLVRELLDKKVRQYVLDFDRVQFIDSAGIGLIIKLAAIIEKHLGSLMMCNPKANVKNVFTMLGIEERFKMYERLGDVLESLGNPLLVETIRLKY
jgi:anti-anti-sigma factor